MLRSFVLAATVQALAACGKPAPQPRVDRLNDGASIVLAVLGDSVASGMFADMPSGKKLTNAQAETFAKVYQLSRTEDPESEEFYLAAQKIAAAPDLTAFAGTEPYSFMKRMTQLRGEPVGLRRYAISGATTASLKSQTDQLTSDKAAGRISPAMIVMHVGANDFCDRTPPDAFRAAFGARLDEIVALHPEALVFVLAIPDIPRILSLPDASTIHVPGLSASCADVRATLKLCSGRNNINPGATTKSYEADAAERVALNVTIESEVARVQAGSKSPGHVAFVPYEIASFDHSLLAVDCFHPNAAGQRAIADATWPTAQALLVATPTPTPTP